MRLIVAGSRGVNDYEIVRDCIYEWMHKKISPTDDLTIISGGARGVDRLAADVADVHHFGLIVKEADWDKYGKSAGYRRNVEMAEQADALLAIWDGKSPGTKHMIDIATDKGLDVTVITV